MSWDGHFGDCPHGHCCQMCCHECLAQWNKEHPIGWTEYE